MSDTTATPEQLAAWEDLLEALCYKLADRLERRSGRHWRAGDHGLPKAPEPLREAPVNLLTHLARVWTESEAGRADLARWLREGRERRQAAFEARPSPQSDESKRRAGIAARGREVQSTLPDAEKAMWWVRLCNALDTPGAAEAMLLDAEKVATP